MRPKKVLELQKQLAEAQRLLGQKQIQLDFTEKLIEIASDELGVDLKKKFGAKPLSGFGKTEDK